MEPSPEIAQGPETTSNCRLILPTYLSQIHLNCDPLRVTSQS
jgi:hypothetical protein